MSLDSLSPRVLAATGLLALAPVAWYGFASSGTAGLFSAVNVGIIFLALYIAMRPVAGADHHGTSA